MIINYGRQSVDNNDIKEVQKVLKSDFLTQGALVTKFENNLKKYLGSRFCTAVNSGTSALYMAVSSLKIEKNSKIITTPITFLSSANAIVHNNHTPIFSDIENNFNTIDPNYIEYLIKKNINKKRKIKAIIAVDYGGNLCDWESLFYLKNKYNLYIINDNCHALGSSYKNDKKYALKYSDIVTQSFHPVKAITTGEGGAIFSNSKKLNEYYKSYRSHGVTKGYRNKPIWHYQMNFLGNNYRLTEIQAALGISQLKKIEEFIDRRVKVAKYYDTHLKINNIIKPRTRTLCRNSYHLYPIRINFKKYKISKNEFFKKN